MNNKNLIETPEEKRKGNFWSWISLICCLSRFFIDIFIAVSSGVMMAIFSESAELGSIMTVFSEVMVTIGTCVSIAVGIAAVVIMIYVRVKYPRNIFGKVLMWVYIVAFAIYIILMVVVIIALGIACAACVDECQNLSMIVVERMMLC